MATTTDRNQPSRMHKPSDGRSVWQKHWRKLILTPIAIGVALWFLVLQPRTAKTVDEAFPTAAPVTAAAKTAPTAAQPALQPTAATQPTTQSVAQPTAAAQPAVQPAAVQATIAQPAAAQATVAPTAAAVANSPTAVKSGEFTAVEHSGSGKATIFKQADGKYILRLENLDITNGPDLRVRLLGASGASLDLGGLKGNKGNQNYDLPADFDPVKYSTADIWCRAFSVQFNKAALA